MSRTSGVLAAMKAVPGGARYTPAPQSGGWGGMNQVAANAMYGNPYQSSYGPFLPRPSRTFTDGAFGPMSPIQPVPVDQPAIPGGFADPRLWQYPVGYNLPTQPGSEGFKLASFSQLQTIASKYNVARRAIELRKEEIAGLEWSIELTTKAAKAYQGDHKAMRDFGERAAKATRFFRHPDPDYFDWSSFLKALLEEIFVFDALSLIFRPKYGKGLGLGLLGSDLDSISLVSGPTIRPLLNMHGGKPRPPAPAYQQYLYGVPRSDYQTVISGSDIDDYGLTGAQVNEFRADVMLYLPLVPRRESPYGFPPIEQALLPIISGLQKQEFQLDYFTEGCYSSDTEILTRNGWKLFTELSDADEVATRGEKGEFEWQIPSARLEYPFAGEMVEFTSKSVELLVTPGHRMLVSRPHAYLAKHQPRDGEDGWHIRLAEHIARAPETRWLYPVTSTWRGAEPGIVRIPGIASPRHPARDVVMEARAFCAFLGIYLAEGWTRQDRNDIYVAQAPTSRHFRAVSDILAETGLHWTYRASHNRFEVTNKALAAWLRDNIGHRAWNKAIPADVKDYSPRLLEALLSAAMLGDGHWGPLGQRYYTTTSERLADDIQEVFQKLGRDAWIRPQDLSQYDAGDAGNGRPIRRSGRIQYVVRERMQDYHWLPKPKRVEYHGTVHCVTVPNGIVYVRRNGKAAWCGNTVPAVYISPGDPNITPTQVKELQDALNGIAGDPAYHLKVIVLPPGSKVDPQRPVDLSDSFDYLVMNQVLMQLDVLPTELGIIPDIGASTSGPSASGIKFGAQASRDMKSRKSTKPLLLTLASIMDYILQDICGQQDMCFSFEGLQDDEDKQAITSLGVEQVQNAISSIDEVRERLDLPPWGLQETSEPVVFTAQGPIPLSMAPQLIANMQAGAQGGAQGTNSGQRTTSSRSRTSQPSVRQGGQTRPNGSHPKPVAPHRESVTPAHSAASGAVQGPGPRTGGTTSRSPVAGSRKRGEGHTDRLKAVQCELDALRRHLRKGRLISTWEAEHIPGRALGMIAEDIAKGVLIDTAVERAGDICLTKDAYEWAGDAESARESGYSAPSGHPEVTKAAHWPGWERDLGLVGAYKNLIGQAFHDAETRGSELRKKAATGGMFVSNSTLRDLISDEVRDVFSGVLKPLWTEAWNLGYAAAKSLVTGQPADFTAKAEGDALQGFIGSEEAHWLSEISRTGLGNNAVRSEMIAWTEVGRAINTAAIQCYRDNGVTHKHLLLSPNACDLCKDAADDGDIPLDAPFSAGGVIGQCHIRCRCCPAPSSVNTEPPLADLGKSAAADDDSRLVWLLLRARDDDGKYRFLLQQRDDGTWGMPGGKPHMGEDPWGAALREVTEEIGDLPAGLRIAGTFHHVEDDGKTQVFLWLCDVPYFTPLLNGSTPQETQGVAWFRRKEIKDLNLAPKFRDDWEHGITLREHATKALQRMVNENGEVLTLTPASQALQAVGARWPYPRRSDGTEDPEHWPDAGPGAVPSELGSAGAEPPNHINDMAEPEPHDTLTPRGGQDGKMPSRGRKPAPPADAFPDQGTEHDEAWPEPQVTLTPVASPVGANTGVPPSGARKNDSGHPVVGSVPAQAPKPYKPHSVEPEAFDPSSAVEEWSPEADSDIVHDLPGARKGAADPGDPNPVEAFHVYSQLLGNFPPKAIGWVKDPRIHWIGPVAIPHDRIDYEDEEKWAAHHERSRVRHFAGRIRRGEDVSPGVSVQKPGRPKINVVDGHHRALGSQQAGKPFLTYVGFVPGEDGPWDETHSSQIHQGADPGNR